MTDVASDVARATPRTKAEALRADFELILARFYPLGEPTAHTRTIANQLVHLVVLHHLLPETP
jgi:hypothetical protein